MENHLREDRPLGMMLQAGRLGNPSGVSLRRRPRRTPPLADRSTLIRKNGMRLLFRGAYPPTDHVGGGGVTCVLLCESATWGCHVRGGGLMEPAWSRTLPGCLRLIVPAGTAGRGPCVSPIALPLMKGVGATISSPLPLLLMKRVGAIISSPFRVSIALMAGGAIALVSAVTLSKHSGQASPPF